jgi:hypothetical protein
MYARSIMQSCSLTGRWYDRYSLYSIPILCTPFLMLPPGHLPSVYWSSVGISLIPHLLVFGRGRMLLITNLILSVGASSLIRGWISRNRSFMMDLSHHPNARFATDVSFHSADLTCTRQPIFFDPIVPATTAPPPPFLFDFSDPERV